MAAVKDCRVSSLGIAQLRKRIPNNRANSRPEPMGFWAIIDDTDRLGSRLQSVWKFFQPEDP